MPLSEDFSWGMIRIVDRLRVTNEYLTFGGRLDAGLVDDAIVAAFTSTAPLLRRGGHSQGWDAGADLVGAFFGRLMIAVDYRPGFEAAIGDASPIARYAAFVRDCAERRRAVSSAGAEDRLTSLIRHEVIRLRRDQALRLGGPRVDCWNRPRRLDPPSASGAERLWVRGTRTGRPRQTEQIALTELDAEGKQGVPFRLGVLGDQARSRRQGEVAQADDQLDGAPRRGHGASGPASTNAGRGHVAQAGEPGTGVVHREPDVGPSRASEVRKAA